MFKATSLNEILECSYPIGAFNFDISVLTALKSSIRENLFICNVHL